MNMVKLNNKLTAQVISFTEVMQSYQGIEQANSFYTYHRERMEQKSLTLISD